MTFDINRFAAACEAAAASDDPPGQVHALVGQAVANPALLNSQFGNTEEEETLLYASDNLVIVHLRLTPNVHYPPHNHNMVAVIGIYCGRERGHSYALHEDRIVDQGFHDYGAGDVAVMDKDAIHSVVNPHTSFSFGLHVYLGNLLTVPRSIWNPASGDEHPYTDEQYFTLARPYDNEKPYAVPETCSAHTANANC